MVGCDASSPEVKACVHAATPDHLAEAGGRSAKESGYGR